LPIDFIWFDLGYTLLYKERESLFAGMLGRKGIEKPIEEIDKAFHLTDKFFMRHFPGLLGASPNEFMPLYFGYLCRNLDIHGDLVSLLVEWMESWKGEQIGWKAYDCVPRVLDELRSRGIRAGVISNWDPSARSILQACGLLDKFETVVISSEVGVSKPHERIFRIALERAGIEPEDCLYVGDNYYDDAVGAEAVGMKALVVNRFESLGVEELSGCRIIRDISDILPYLEEAAC
jgi:putative hydrolase of the HAD superfamily